MLGFLIIHAFNSNTRIDNYIPYLEIAAAFLKIEDEFSDQRI